MIITIHQPEHLPWLGFFNKLAKCELFVILDSVQYEKSNFQNRNKIIGSNGVQYISIPAKTTDHLSGTIGTTEIAVKNNPKWKIKYLNTIRASYGKHPYFNEVFPILENAINIDTIYLSDINIAIFTTFSKILGFNPKYIKSSDLDIKGKKSDLILDICKQTNADVYISGPVGREYLKLDEFKENNIEVVYNDYNHPEYPQKKQKEFIPYMSALDLFMNCGFEDSKQIIMKGNEEVSKE